MGITQTYFLAHTARGKLAREAAKPDHNLRLLVGHANMLDNLMIELSEAESQQERYFNDSARSSVAVSENKQSKHIQWADTPVIREEEEEEEEQHVPNWRADDLVEEDDDEDSASDDDSDYGDDDAFFIDVAPSYSSTNTAEKIKLQRASSPKLHITPPPPLSSTPTQINDPEHDDYLSDEAEFDDEDDLADLALTRTHSHSPPELLSDDSEAESEEDDGPLSPPPVTDFDHFASESSPEASHDQAEVMFPSASQIYLSTTTKEQPALKLTHSSPTLPLSKSDQQAFLSGKYLFTTSTDGARMIEAF